MRKRKEYSELKFIDDFMFCKIMVTKPELCKELLELILGFKIRKIKFPESQKNFKPKYNRKGIRVDVYVEDDENSVYDLEMQTSNNIEIPKRMRYYQGSIDTHILKESEKYSALKKSYIIFICLEDMFGKNFPVYTFENICKQDTSVLLNDEAYKVVINAAGNRIGLSKEMADFLDFLQEKQNDGKLAGELDKAVNEAIQKESWKEEYGMYTMEMKIQDERMEAAVFTAFDIFLEYGVPEPDMIKKVMDKFQMNERDAKYFYKGYLRKSKSE